MATTSRSALRQRLGESTFTYHSGTATGGSSSTLVDSNLENRFGSDDDLEGMWVIVTSGNADGDIRRISAYTASTGTLTPHTNFSASVASSDTYELHEVHPDDVHNALNRASELLFPELYAAVIDESLIVDNLLSNSGFENWTAGSPDDWSSVASPTLTQETSRVWRGSSSIKIEATGGSEGVRQDIFTSVNMNEVAGKTIRVRGFVWASSANAARLRVSFDGNNTFTDSDDHGGSSEWEELDVDVDIPADATSINVHPEVSASETAYFDDVIAYIDPVYRYTLPSTILRGPDSVEMQHNKNRPLGPYYPIMTNERLIAGRVLRVRGRNRLSALSADSDTIEVDGDRAEAVIQRAKLYLATMLKNRTRDAFYETWERDAEAWLNTHLPRVKMPVTAEFPQFGTWRIEENSTTREIVFTRDRG